MGSGEEPPAHGLAAPGTVAWRGCLSGVNGDLNPLEVAQHGELPSNDVVGVGRFLL